MLSRDDLAAWLLTQGDRKFSTRDATEDCPIGCFLQEVQGEKTRVGYISVAYGDGRVELLPEWATVFLRAHTQYLEGDAQWLARLLQ